MNTLLYQCLAHETLELGINALCRTKMCLLLIYKLLINFVLDNLQQISRTHLAFNSSIFICVFLKVLWEDFIKFLYGLDSVASCDLNNLLDYCKFSKFYPLSILSSILSC